MMKCEDVQKELEAFFSNDIDDTIRTEIQNHLDECQDCSRALRKLTGLSEVLKTWRGIEPSPIMYAKLKARVEAHESFWGRIFTNPFVKKAAIQFVEVAAIVALTLLVSHLLHKPNPEMRDDLATINFYLTEHQEAVAQTISAAPTRPAMRMYMNRDDIIYYESMDEFPESARHGIILRRPSSQRETYLPKAPVISNGRVLTLAQARNAVNFNPVIPSRL